jgi:hypothetical protein
VLSHFDLIGDAEDAGSACDVLFGRGSLRVVPDMAGERQLSARDRHMEVLGVDPGVRGQPLERRRADFIGPTAVMAISSGCVIRRSCCTAVRTSVSMRAVSVNMRPCASKGSKGCVRTVSVGRGRIVVIRFA